MDAQSSPMERLIRLRKALGFSQRDLAKEFGVTSGAIALWETGARVVPGPVLNLIKIYESSLPNRSNGKPELNEDRGEELLKEAKASLEICDVSTAREAHIQISRGVSAYVEDTDAANSLGGKLRIALMQRLLKSLKNSKGVSVKIAQLASYMEIGLPQEVRQALGTFQLHVRRSSEAAINEIIKAEYGLPLKKMFPHWREEPLAVTSLGQVHYARLENGREVAVKVQHPQIEEILQRQFRNIEFLQTLATVFGREDHGIVQEIRRSIFEECDYFLEAENQQSFRKFLSEDPRMIVPEVYTDLVRRRVLVSEFIRGSSFQSFAARADQGQRNSAAETILEAVTKGAFAHFHIQTDLHGGNFLFTGGQVAFLDFGRVYRRPADLMRKEAQFYLSFLRNEYEKCRESAAHIFAKDAANFDFEPFWVFLQNANVHLFTDGRFKFTREYAQGISREGRVYSKRYQMRMNGDMFWSFVFNASLWGLLAELNPEINFRKIAFKIIPMSN